MSSRCEEPVYGGNFTALAVSVAIMACEMFPCAVRRLLLLFSALAALSLISFASLRAQSAPPAASPSPSNSTVVELRIDGEIEPILAEYIVRGIEQADAEHASLILITINTPGGLDTSMRDIIQSILRSPVPVVTYVYPTGSRAASAGFFILLSSDVAAMSPGTETGAASPLIEIGGSSVQIDDTLRKKIVNDATAYLRSYTSKRERNPELAATAVTDAKAFSDKEALDGKLVEIVTASKEDLLAQLNGRNITRFDGTKLTLALPHPAISGARNDRPRKISLAHRAARRLFHPADYRSARPLRGIHPSRCVRPRRVWCDRPAAGVVCHALVAREPGGTAAHCLRVRAVHSGGESFPRMACWAWEA